MNTDLKYERLLELLKTFIAKYIVQYNRLYKKKLDILTKILYNLTYSKKGVMV